MDFVPLDSPSSPALPPSERAATGVEGLDDILGGGWPARRLYLVQGEPGTGKTTLSLQFLLRGLAQGEKCLYISLSESREEIIQVAASHGWSLEGLDIVEMSHDDNTLSPDEQNTLFLPSEVELSEVTTRILGEIDRLSPVRVVFDSLSEWRLMSGDGLRFRRQILALKNHLSARGATVLLLDGNSAGQAMDLQSLAHGVLQLQQVHPEYGAERRRLGVVKLRGARFRGGYHDFAIKPGGIAVFPRLVATEHAVDFPVERVPSGLREIDELLGGGITRGTATLLVGASGTGKSMLTQRYIESALERGEGAALFAFEESRDIIERRATRFGFELSPYIQDGSFHLQTIDPAELSAGEFAWKVRQSVEESGAKLVVFDSLNGYLYSMGQERNLLLHMHELLSYLSARGIVTLLIVCQNGMVGSSMQSPVDVSYLADTVLLLRHFEAFGEVKQAVSVVKKRDGGHERAIRELHFSSEGLQVGPPLRDFKGVLTGVPDFIGVGGPLLGGGADGQGG